MEIFGYTFSNPALLERALTTPAYRMDFPDALDNQRLEFLGDAVLGLLSAQRLFEELPNVQEGQLTVKRTHMVSTAALCAAANRFGLEKRLKRNRCASALTAHSKTLADAIEAIIGAVYLDGGLDAAKRIFLALELPLHAEAGSWSCNPKGDLQMYGQAMIPQCLPEYTLLSTKGPAHAPIFTVRVSLKGHGEATAQASTHKEAEQLAAAELLKGLPSRTAPSDLV